MTDREMTHFKCLALQTRRTVAAAKRQIYPAAKAQSQPFTENDTSPLEALIDCHRSPSSPSSMRVATRPDGWTAVICCSAPPRLHHYPQPHRRRGCHLYHRRRCRPHRRRRRRHPHLHRYHYLHHLHYRRRRRRHCGRRSGCGRDRRDRTSYYTAPLGTTVEGVWITR